MRNKFKLQGILFITLLFTLLICFNWYSNLNETREYVVENTDYKLSSTEVETYVINPNPNRQYFILKKSVYQGQNSLIPFVVNKKLIKVYKPIIISDKF